MTTSVGKSFHPSTTLLLKKCPLTQRRYRFLQIFSWCPLVGLLDIASNKSLSTLSIPFKISYAWFMSARSHWYSNEGGPRVFKRSGYDRVFKSDTSLVARRWTFFYLDGIFLYIGAQIVVTYSRCGQTKDLNRFRNISLSINVNVLNLSQAIWFGLITNASFLQLLLDVIS